MSGDVRTRATAANDDAWKDEGSPMLVVPVSEFL